MKPLRKILDPASYFRLAGRVWGDRHVRRARGELRKTERPRAGAFRVAIIPPAIPGSVGDAAMISASAEYLLAQGAEYVDLLFGGEWPLDAAIRRRIDSSEFFYRGSQTQHAAVLRQLSGYTHLFFIGADVIDGAYAPGSVRRRLSLLSDFAAIGGQARVLGASYNEHPEETTRRALARLPAAVDICARDPVSFDRMQRVIGRTPRQVADLAFLLKPLPEHPDAHPALAWIEGRRAAGDRVVALNGNYLQVAKEPGLRVALRLLIQMLTAENTSVLLVPHDSRSEESDHLLLARAQEGLTDDERQRTYLLDTVSPGVVKASLAVVDFLVTGRLHAQILAMGSGTPVMSLVYQGKFEGLLQLFELDPAEFLVTPAAFAADPAGLAARVLALLDRSDELRARINARLPFVTGLSQGNFRP